MRSYIYGRRRPVRTTATSASR